MCNEQRYTFRIKLLRNTFHASGCNFSHRYYKVSKRRSAEFIRPGVRTCVGDPSTGRAQARNIDNIPEGRSKEIRQTPRRTAGQSLGRRQSAGCF